MQTCRTCDAEVTDVGCPACEPSVDVAAVAAIASTPRWHEAGRHRRPATRAALGLIGAIALAGAGAGLVAVAPAGLVPGAALIAAGLALAVIGARIWLTPLRPWPAAVLASTVERVQDGKGRSTYHHALHVVDQDAQRHALTATAAQVAGHLPGTALIAFTRGGHLDDAWAVPWPTVPASAPREAEQRARAALAAVDRDRLAEFDDGPRTPPRSAYRIPIAIAGAAALTAVAALVVPAWVGDAADARTAAQAGGLFGYVAAATAAVTAAAMAIAIRRRPLARHLVVALGHVATDAGPALDVIDARGQRRRWPAAAAAAARVPLDVPLLVGTHDGRIVACWEFTARDPLPSAIAGPRDRTS
ncbi:MAG: hypothetical protein JNK64_14295 [Myxococcales bacterium]|nr:hypothetical protein [Myxococcales bacterium]